MIGYNFREKNSSVKFKLLDLIREGKLKSNGKPNKLPSENDLAEILDVSLLTVREALKSLEFEGFISKKHGAGNFYHQSVLGLKMRIDLIADYTSLLTDAGFTVETRQTDHSLRYPDEREQHAFDLSPQERLVSFNRTYYADGRVAILMTLITPCSTLKIPFDENESIDTLEEFLWGHARIKIVNSIENLVPRNATETERAAFGLTTCCPMICINHTFLSILDEKVGFATSAFNPEIMKMNMIRKWY